ncbi:MAG TPA: DUF2877 domain-containing protein [Spirochaetia bacterium]|nr:DUF2877 domain-containing protein [Spirochaetia bacterium]
MTAEAIGSLVPAPAWSGAVVSIYSTAVNLLHPDGLLVGLVAAEGQMSPFSLLVPELFRASTGANGVLLQVAMPCRLSGNQLRIGPLTVELDAATIWSGLLEPHLEGGISTPGNSLRRLEEALGAAGTEGGFLSMIIATASPTIFNRKASELLAQIEETAGSRASVLAGLSGLVGLGIGFTPSGDDFISGALLAEQMTAGRGGRIDREEIRYALGRTNYGGRTLLSSVLDRRFPDYLLQLASSLHASELVGQSDEGAASRLVVAAVRAAASHGETSGTDAMSGAAWYLRLAAGDLFV